MHYSKLKGTGRVRATGHTAAFWDTPNSLTIPSVPATNFYALVTIRFSESTNGNFDIKHD